MLEFKLDENLPLEATAVFVSAGHDAMTASEQRLGGTPDSIMAVVCQQEGRAILTLDMDFADIRAYPPEEHSGIIVLRLARQDRYRIPTTLKRLIPILTQEPLVGKLWIVDESTVRIRG